MTIIRRALTPVILIALLAVNATAAFAADLKVVAYYFHGNARCSTCHNMEEYASESIEKNFKDELANGSLLFKTVNVEEKENEHFVDDYQLYTKAIIISRIENGKETRHKNLTDIWEYVRDKERFFDYITTEIDNFLEDAPQ